MGFGGHVSDMINRSRENRDLKKRKKERYQKVKDAYMGTYESHDKLELAHNKLSEEEMNIFREKLSRKKRRENLMVMTLLITIALLAIVLIIYFIR